MRWEPIGLEAVFDFCAQGGLSGLFLRGDDSNKKKCKNGKGAP